MKVDKDCILNYIRHPKCPHPLIVKTAKQYHPMLETFLQEVQNQSPKE